MDELRFECQSSGKCCTSRGAYGYVYLTAEDRNRFAKYFGMTTAAFVREHCETTGGNVHLKNPETDCAFLRGRKCSVYEARPVQCRTWPFWPENLHAKTWTSEIASFCPGVGKGRLYSPEEVETLLAEMR